jgi:hypothetical protein
MEKRRGNSDIRRNGTSGGVDEKGRLPYKPRELSAMTRPKPGAALLGPERPVLGRIFRTHPSIRQANCPAAENNP